MTKTNSEPVLYYADGYHAGLFLRNEKELVSQMEQLLASLSSRSEWKFNLEIEAYALEELVRRKAKVISCCQQYLAQRRMEIINGSYAQPYPSLIGGESMIRQLQLGKEIIGEVFPGHEVVTYAVQEPCWGSQLPQILVGLGYRYCVLRNHFTYFGEPKRIDGQKIWWIGPDGSRIEAVPSYSCFERRPHNDSGVRAGEDYLKTALKNGITEPIGFFIEDIGGAPSSYEHSSPQYLKLVTWREYFETTPPPTTDCNLSQEDLLFAIQWGSQKLVEIAQSCRRTELNVLRTEKLAFVAALFYGMKYPSGNMETSWKLLMMCQHHDPWVCCESRMGDFADHPYWQWIEKWTGKTNKICNHTLQNTLSPIFCSTGWDKQTLPVSVAVVNILGQERDDVAAVELPAPIRNRPLRVVNCSEEDVPFQRIRGGSKLLFQAHIPSFGYRMYRLVPSDSPPDEPRANIKQTKDSLTVQTSLLRVVFDKAHGGCINSLYDKEHKQELVDLTKGYWGDFLGYLTDWGRWERASSKPAAVRVVENGPVMTRVRVTGGFHLARYRLDVTIYEKTKRADFQAHFDFGSGITVGDPHRAPHWSNPQQSWHNDQMKLQVQFPVALQGVSLYKDSAFDVTRSRLEDNFYHNWYDLKTNVIQNWADISNNRYGVTFHPDFVTSYGFSDSWPFSFILGWDRLVGKATYSYGISLHEGDWVQGKVPLTDLRRSNPPVIIGPESSELIDKAHIPLSRSWMELSPADIELSAAYIHQGKFFIRLFNNSSKESLAKVRLYFNPEEDVVLTRLDGAPLQNIEVEKETESCSIPLRMPPFGLKTLRIGRYTGNDRGGRILSKAKKWHLQH